VKYLKYLPLVFCILSFCGRPEVTEPGATFTIIGECQLPGYAKKVELVGNLAYVADGQGGLQIVDISNPESTYVVGQYVSDRDVNSVAVRDTFAYIALLSSTSGGLVVLNISDPAVPLFVGQDPTIYAYDIAAPQDDTMYVYVAARYWFHVEDIYTFPQYPTYARRFTTPGNTRAVFVIDSLVYLACEQMGLQIINLAKPDSLALVGWIDTPSNARHVYVHDNKAYVADGRAGLIIIDVADSEHPVFIEQYDTPEYANAVFISNDKAYIADGDGGVYVIDVSNAQDPIFYGSFETAYANHAYVRNDTVYVADRDRGLVVVVEEAQ
jgi:hypothetical protein